MVQLVDLLVVSHPFRKSLTSYITDPLGLPKKRRIFTRCVYIIIIGNCIVVYIDLKGAKYVRSIILYMG